MLQPGVYHHLSVLQRTAGGVYLDAGSQDPLFLPASELSEAQRQSEAIRVFVYLDRDEQYVATTATPHAEVGQCGYLRVLSETDSGAFLDWGLPKDLLLPRNEQAYPVREGKSYLVYLFIDERTGRIAATTRLHLHLSEQRDDLETGQKVDLVIASKSDIGYKAVINNRQLGVIYYDELGHQTLRFGDRMKGWVKEPREDGKIDLSVTRLDVESRNQLTRQILDDLNARGGRSDLTDKSTPEQIFHRFKTSKKNYKRALGRLYKQGCIELQPDHVLLLDGALDRYQVDESLYAQKNEPAAKRADSKDSRQPRERTAGTLSVGGNAAKRGKDGQGGKRRKPGSGFDWRHR